MDGHGYQPITENPPHTKYLTIRSKILFDQFSCLNEASDIFQQFLTLSDTSQHFQQFLTISDNFQHFRQFWTYSNIFQCFHPRILAEYVAVACGELIVSICSYVQVWLNPAWSEEIDSYMILCTFHASHQDSWQLVIFTGGFECTPYYPFP